MPGTLSEFDLQSALDACAAEPIHIPGQVQPFGAVLAFDFQTDEILYASANTQKIIGHEPDDLLASSFSDVFGRDIVHAISNVASYPNFAKTSLPLGAFKINDRPLELHAFASDGCVVVEFEAEGSVAFENAQALDAIALMIESIQNCTTQTELCDLTVDLMRHFTGYDRVMIYKFDRDYNGEVVAEEKRTKLEPFIGLRFPEYDIPSQARDIMLKMPLRIIEDADHTPVPLLAKNSELPPLNISFAGTRGVSPIHLAYLRNMGSKATMTLSIVTSGALWGIISFHHQTPHVPSAKLRQVLAKFVPILTSKLEAILQTELLHQIKDMDHVKDRLLIEIDEDTEMEAFFPGIAKTITGILKADGLAAIVGSQDRCHGMVPGQSVLAELLNQVHKGSSDVLVFDNLRESFPNLVGDMNGTAGAIVHAINPGRAICFFRKEIEREVSWAGNPKKTVELVGGHSRLMPRGSFMSYLEKVRGTCEPWSDQDMIFMRQIWAIINSAERRALMNTLTRQQSIMIDELNHRVRNILALVRSVSKQAGRRYGSLDSYSKALEARIQALAAAHDIASGRSAKAIELQTLIRTEFGPYEEKNHVQVKMSGENPLMRADIAPIFSLIVHELTTNAAKYGALSDIGGKVTVMIERVARGFQMTWRESGGPPVSEPKEFGFGATLIREAVPHEMNGHTTLTFAETGVCAEIFLPEDLFNLAKSSMMLASIDEVNEPELSVPEKIGFLPKHLKGTALVLEDNFVIAKEMGDQLSEFGFEDVVKVSSVEKALDFIDREVPSVAVLDVNLGAGETSEDVAARLAELNVAFIFVTGYGEKMKFASGLGRIPRLAKPVEDAQLKAALAVQLSKT